MNLVFTSYNDKNICALFDDKKMVQADVITPLEHDDNLHSGTGNIYVGKVKNIVPNINAAFIDVGIGEQCFMQVEERIGNAPAYRLNGELVGIKRESDIVVQYIREGIKTKQPVVSTDISITGRYLILVNDSDTISVSNKIKNKVRRKEIITIIESDNNDDTYKGYIVRTNAEDVSEERLIAEKRYLDSLYKSIMQKAGHADTYSCIYRAPDEYVSILRDSYSKQLDKIITDNQTIYDSLLSYINEAEPELGNKLELYTDDYPLAALYELESNMTKALGKKVWLKSGAYIIIEPTEACTVIDVNSGKAIAGKKNKENTIYKINEEAATEIIRQLRLRNISGIIIIDFVDMKNEENRYALMNHLKEIAAEDPIKTTFVDMTALGLVEMTRHKRRKSLAEQFASAP